MLNFTPHVKRKKGVKQKSLINLFPTPTTADGPNFRGLFSGISVEVNDRSHILSIYEGGCYGKGSKSRSAPKLVTAQGQQGSDDSKEINQQAKDDETLTLFLEEAFFLAHYLEVLKIYTLQEEHEMSWQELLTASENLNSDFLECLAAYLYLKAKGWIIKSGIKFGGHYLIYKKGPRYYHASFIVLISTNNNEVSLAGKDIKGLQRIAETSDKDVLLLQLIRPKNFELKSLANIEDIEITETIVRRFNYTAFVQNQNISKNK